MLNNTFVLDTSALLKGSEQVFSIMDKQKLKAVIPSVVMDELDNIKDNPNHKENRNAHKVLQHIHAFETKEISTRKREQGIKNDTQIIQCAKEFNAWIISEDKTFSIQYDRTLSIAGFRDKFETYNENIPDSIAREFFCALTKRDFAKAQEILESIFVVISYCSGVAFVRAGVKKNSSLGSMIRKKSNVHGVIPNLFSMGIFGFSNALRHSSEFNTKERICTAPFPTGIRENTVSSFSLCKSCKQDFVVRKPSSPIARHISKLSGLTN